MLSAVERDFARDIWCILGLPFDSCSINDTCMLMDKGMADNQQNFLATPNLDWIAMSLYDIEFKKAVIKSDISTADGAPIVWVSRFLGLPVKERVAGSTFLECLLSKNTGKSYRIFFFGGEKSVSEKISLSLGEIDAGLETAGYCCPGYGSVDEMSGEPFITEINKASADILSVSLGAKKGVLWIDRNRRRLNTRFIAHFGAAINFISKSISRAPRWMQRLGMEWIWRIAAEPKLVKRYLKDGIIFLYLAVNRIVPHKFFLLACKKYASSREEPVIDIAEDDLTVRLKIKGICNHLNDVSVREMLKECAAKEKDVLLDLSETEYVDNHFLGLLLLLFKYKSIQNRKLLFTGMSGAIRRIFNLNLVNDIFKQSA